MVQKLSPITLDEPTTHNPQPIALLFALIHGTSNNSWTLQDFTNPPQRKEGGGPGFAKTSRPHPDQCDGEDAGSRWPVAGGRWPAEVRPRGAIKPREKEYGQPVWVGHFTGIWSPELRGTTVLCEFVDCWLPQVVERTTLALPTTGLQQFDLRSYGSQTMQAGRDGYKSKSFCISGKYPGTGGLCDGNSSGRISKATRANPVTFWCAFALSIHTLGFASHPGPVRNSQVRCRPGLLVVEGNFCL